MRKLTATEAEKLAKMIDPTARFTQDCFAGTGYEFEGDEAGYIGFHIQGMPDSFTVGVERGRWATGQDGITRKVADVRRGALNRGA